MTHRLAKQVPTGITTLHAADYRNPAELPNGGVLIVGASSSQIAYELHLSGRPVPSPSARTSAYRGSTAARHPVVDERRGPAGRALRRDSRPATGAQPTVAASRLTLDKNFFDEISCLVELIAQVDQALPADSAIRSDPPFTKLRAHRKIDHLNVVTSNLPPQLSNAGDFSRSSIEARIRAGYQYAMEQGIGDIDAPGLRFGV